MSPIGSGFGGSGRGGGGLILRNPPDEFIAASLAAARVLRDTFFNTAGNASILTQYQANQSLSIVLGVMGATARTFETYEPGNEGGAYDNTKWLERTSSVQGATGARGAQARFVLSCFRNGLVAPATPVGGSYVVATGVLTTPADTTALPTVPATGENIYESQSPVNPAVDTGTIIPVWSPFVEPVEENAEQGAEAAQTAAEAAQTAAEAAQTAAEAARTAAQTAQANAETAETNAETAETNAEAAETNAETAETNAELARTRAEAARTGAETALAGSGAALAFTELWSGNIDITTANQWKAVGATPVPANATWLLWNGGKLSDGDDDGPAALWTWIRAADWRALIADTVDTTPGDGTGMLLVEWATGDIGNSGSISFARRDVVIGRTANDVPLITSGNASEDFQGARLLYITQAVATPGGGLSEAQVNALIAAADHAAAADLTVLAARVTTLEGYHAAQPPGDHTRYAAASADVMFTEAEWLAGATSPSGVIVFPAVAFGHTKGFAIPADQNSLADIRVEGSAFNTRGSYNPDFGDPDVLTDINGVMHKTYIAKAPDYANDNLDEQARTYVLR